VAKKTAKKSNQPKKPDSVLRMPKGFIDLPGLHVTVDEVRYQPEAETPPEQPHCFVYFISIRNDSLVPVTIRGRKWVVRNSRGEVTAVEGDGVVGQCPTLAPGEKFSYNSYHLIDHLPAVAEGSYLGTLEGGKRVIVRIPKFELVLPAS
jgi:ApaG protein